MKRRLSIIGYALSFLAGTFVTGGVAMAATNYVQALKGVSTVQLNGKTIEQPPKLVYGGTTYVQLYSIEQALKQARITPGWDGKNFTMESAPANTSDIAGLSGGSSDNITVYADLGRSMITVGVSGYKLAQLSPTSSPSTITTTIEQDIQLFKDNYSALSKDAPTDPSLQTMLTQYLSSLNQFVTIYTQLDTAIKNNDATLANQVMTELPAAEQQLATLKQEVQNYSSTLTQSVTANTTG